MRDGLALVREGSHNTTKKRGGTVQGPFVNSDVVGAADVMQANVHRVGLAWERGRAKGHVFEVVAVDVAESDRGQQKEQERRRQMQHRQGVVLGFGLEDFS